jgi:TRAP-type uncharacterized transport system substrate-binding protein
VIPLLSESIIAVGKGELLDIKSAKLIQELSKKDINSTNFIIKEFENPLKSLKNSKACFAITQGDILKDEKEKSSNIKSIVSLYPKYLEFMIRRDLNISHLSDIKTVDTKIAINGKNSQNIVNMLIKKLDLNSFKFLTLDKNQTLNISNSDKIGGYIGFELSNSISGLNNIFRPISLNGKPYAQLIRMNSYLLKGSIKNNRFKNQNHDIITIGVKSILITTTDCESKAIYDITNIILNNQEKFKKLHHLYKDISRKNLLEELVLPQDKEAIKAFNNIKEEQKL